ncbi:PAS domain S-box-containing protein [Marinilabilia salmonicolor]|jgi:PAS domain S-box-containing protein|uniref:PAS domain S-box protein n=1 Tax=Marinilabilia salmonicolor TaxID=989 RepID=UPI000D04F4E4|nr:PAS domain S-box protein [Marinilabilia salmonicolor]PRY95851.1 PAS domain S-box-containing protein [Marinilabilia salmonicolor]
MDFNFKRFRRIFENAPLGIFLTTGGGQFVDLNERLATILGYDSVDDIKHHVRDIGTDLYLNVSDRREILRKTEAATGIIVEEVQFKKKDGKVIFVRLSISKYREERSGDSVLIGMVEDISENKALVRKLAERENLLSSIVNSLPFELWVLDLQEKVISQSAFSKRKWGSYTGKKVKDFLLNENPGVDLGEFILQAWQGESVDIEKEIRLKGKSKFYRFLLTPLRDGGVVNGVILIGLDQTERVTAQRRVLAIQKFLETVINSVPVRVFWKSKDLVYQGGNAAFLKDVKLDKEEELIGKTNHDFFDAKELIFFQKIFQDVITSGRPMLNFKAWLNARTVSGIYILASVVPLFSKSGNEVTGVLCCYQDITLMKKMEEELLVHRNDLERLVDERTRELDQLNEELMSSNEELSTLNEALSRQKEELAATLEELKRTQDKLIQSEKMASLGIVSAGIAHEINNPLNFISSGTQGIEVVMKEIDLLFQEMFLAGEIKNVEKSLQLRDLFRDMKQLIISMHTGVERTSEIVKGLRVFSRMDPEKKSFADVHELIEVALTILRNKYKNHITIDRKFGEIPKIKCYPGKLSQVFLNLLMNAIQSIQERGSIEVSTSMRNDEKQIMIVISDDGDGIPDQIKNRVFDPFFTTKTVNEGTGMGLSIVHSIISMHGGEINFESLANKGTIFRVLLPVE